MELIRSRGAAGLSSGVFFPNPLILDFAMQGPLRLLVILSLTAAFATGCHKKTPQAGTTPASASAATPAADGHEPSLRTEQAAAPGKPQKLPGVPSPADLTAVGADSGDLPRADADSGMHKSIRLEKYNEVDSPFILESVEGETAHIKRLDQSPPKIEEVHKGQTLTGSSLKVEKIVSRRGTDKDGAPVDASRVTLTKPATKEETVLVKDLPTRSTATSAVLVSADGSTTKTVKLGETFSWPGEKEVTYKVLDIRPDQAILQEVETGKTWTVPKR
jgi:hypothetical protein